MLRRFKTCVTFLAVIVAVGPAAAQVVVPTEDLAHVEFPDDPKILIDTAATYENGEGVPRDYLKAMALYCKAAKTGSADAQFALGWMYANGRGVARDDGVAVQLFAMAAVQGHRQARVMLPYVQGAAVGILPRCLLPEPSVPIVDRMDDAYQPRNVLYKQVEDFVDKLAPRFEVDPKLVLAIISVESGFNNRAISPKNAQGLMQLIPETAQRFHVKNVFDVEDNLKGGLAYLQWLLAFYKGNVKLVLAAYNAGEKAVEAYRGVPPYPETQEYVRRISLLYKKAIHPYKRDLLAVTSKIP